MEANHWFARSPSDSAMLLQVSVDRRSSHLYLINMSTKTIKTTSSSTHASPGSKEEKEKEERKGVCDNLEFAQCWNTTLSEPILKYLADLPHTWLLDVLRSGYAGDRTANPIVVHLFIGQNADELVLTGELALEIVRVVAEIIWSNWKGESVYVDVCKPQLQVRGCFTTESEPSSVNPDHYIRNPPFPGASIGQMVNETEGVSGTLTGYVKHQGIFYYLTCHHCLPRGPGSPLESPSPFDHRETNEALNADVAALLPKSAMDKIRHCIFKKLSKLFRELVYVDFWRKVMEDSKTWDSKLGVVEHSSLHSEIMTFDWCLTPHVPLHQFNSRSGFRHPPVPGFPSSSIAAAKSYFAPGPSFASLRKTPLSSLDMVFKPPSRTTSEWTIGRVNSIYTATKSTPGGVPYKCYCIVSAIKNASAVCSRHGDSGSVILDKDFRPVAMVQSGTFATARQMDVIHAVGLVDILADIESVTGWKHGSVVFCEGGD
ncbi:hypothetical protein DL95DRAFT_461126 [Leptodontidium sp. 2 PMI_412]|nr:hypothetical protein DL95DRAFT_461126 [Leptodontidium sp. 2 PMI_412]